MPSWCFYFGYKKGIRVGITQGHVHLILKEIEKALSIHFTESAIEDFHIPSENLNSDIHASAEYRAHLVKVMAKRAIKKLS